MKRHQTLAANARSDPLIEGQDAVRIVLLARELTISSLQDLRPHKERPKLNFCGMASWQFHKFVAP